MHCPERFRIKSIRAQKKSWRQIHAQNNPYDGPSNIRQVAGSSFERLSTWGYPAFKFPNWVWKIHA